MKKTFFLLISSVLFVGGCFEYHKNLPQGPWLGVIRIDSTVADMDLPFNMIYEKNPEMEAFYVMNAGETIMITEFDRMGDSVWMKFPVFTSEIAAVFRHDSLVGTYFPKGRGNPAAYAFYAVPGVTDRFPWYPDSAAFSVTGRWQIVENPESQDSSLMVGEFVQEGGRVTGTMLNPTGDYRYLEGKVAGNRFLLSRVDGAHSMILDALITHSGTMEGGRLMGSPSWKSTWHAWRDEQAVIPGSSALLHVKPDAPPFTFSMPDINGDTVSLSDPRFSGKVVIVQAMGTWCPNCLDEAVFYRDIYSGYREKGLEIVALCFEDKTLEGSVSRMKRFIAQTGAGYLFLYAGPRGRESIRSVLYPLEGVIAYPTTLFLDKNGAIRKVETGFSGPGTGKHYERWADDTRKFIEELLSMPISPTRLPR